MMHLLQRHLQTAGKRGRRAGIYSVCSAHPWVLRAAAEQAREDSSLLLVEATSNQVNQVGGYTGMRPADFRRLAESIAESTGFDCARLILGGDHLGPNPWRNEDAETAMNHAIDMVREYAAAGFSKIHLDASMPCGGDGPVLNDAAVAVRAARLCSAAESASADAGFSGPVYVIGTEVPAPGGATHELGGVAITSVAAAQQTLDVHRKAFASVDLKDAWTRVLAMVVQPGVEFDHENVIEYDRAKATNLTSFLGERGGSLVFEAHSTDYQRPEAYADLVQDGFCILKVGPALTFAMREALFALEMIESELIAKTKASGLREVLERTMLAEPKSWRAYYDGGSEQQRRLRTYSYSDRIRYYWNHPEAKSAVDRLMSNLEHTGLPETMLSAYLPAQYSRMREGLIKPDAEAVILDRIRDVLRVYAAAC